MTINFEMRYALICILDSFDVTEIHRIANRVLGKVEEEEVAERRYQAVENRVIECEQYECDYRNYGEIDAE